MDRIVQIKNNKNSTDVWAGQQIDSGEVFTVSDDETLGGFIADPKTNADVWNGNLLIGNGSVFFEVPSDGANWLKGNVQEVITQFEKRDKTLKLAHGEATVGFDSTATILMKIPGTPGSGDGRWISSGTAFFDVVTPGDKIISVRFVDHDNILGGGADAIVGSYTDDDAASANQGWAIPPTGVVKCDTVGGYGFAPSGLYIQIVGKKAKGIIIGTLYVNFEWAKSDS